ncbi:MAG: hypothetical protein KGL59_07375 [Acidobacteriota bacterium]|nr:hypothetical protein [Acidobacteriota bacterium]
MRDGRILTLGSAVLVSLHVVGIVATPKAHSLKAVLPKPLAIAGVQWHRLQPLRLSPGPKFLMNADALPSLL